VSAPGPHDAITPAALPAIEALEAMRGDASDFARAEAELKRLARRPDWRRLAGPLLLMPGLIASFIFGPSIGLAFFLAAAVAAVPLEIWRARTPRARAVKRIRNALADWLALSPQARDT
jgi:hypothetical protein